MNKEIADKWVAALRSGEYNQTRGALRRKDNFCCLGVLCDLSNLGSWKEGFGIYIASKESNPPINEMNSSSLPASVQKWSGMRTAAGHLPEPISIAHPPAMPGLYQNLAKSLMDLNDSARWTFKEIADVIENNWERL